MPMMTFHFRQLKTTHLTFRQCSIEQIATKLSFSLLPRYFKTLTEVNTDTTAKVVTMLLKRATLSKTGQGAVVAELTVHMYRKSL